MMFVNSNYSTYNGNSQDDQRWQRVFLPQPSHQIQNSSFDVNRGRIRLLAKDKASRKEFGASFDFDFTQTVRQLDSNNNNNNSNNNNRNIYKFELVGASNGSSNPPKLSLFGTFERGNNSNTRRLRIICFKYEFQDNQDNTASVSPHIRSTAATQANILHSVLGGSQLGSNNNGNIVNNPNSSFSELLSPHQQPLSAAMANLLQSPSYVHVVFCCCLLFLVGSVFAFGFF